MTASTRASQIHTLYKQLTAFKNVIEKYISDEALALLNNLKYIKYQYQNLWTHTKNKNTNIYPT